MAARRPLVRIGGQNVQLPAGDTVPGLDATKLPLAGGSMSGQINEAPIITVVPGEEFADGRVDSGKSANTYRIAVAGNFTGLYGSTKGSTRRIQFAVAGVVLIHSDTTFILPTGANITSQNGDWAEFIRIGQEAYENWWVCTSYQRKDGTALIGTLDNSKLAKAGGTMSGPFNEAYGSASLSAGILTWDSNGNAAFVSGNAGDQISAVSDPSVTTAGATRRITFVSPGLILVHSNNLVLPTQANITVRNGDAVILQAGGANAWRVISYLRADGTALAGSPDASKVPLTAVGAANGVAPLGSDSKIAAAYLPSYVDDVLEYTNLAAFPATGETGKIYIALDTNREYRWSGSTYIQLVASPGTTDNVPEGTTNLYFTTARVLGTALAGFASAVGAVSASDSILSAIGKLQGTKVDAVSGKGLSTNDYTTAEQTKLAGIATGATNNPDTGTLAEGTNLYFTQNRVRATLLTGLSVATGGVIAAADTVLQAFGKLQNQLSNLTKSSVGLPNVDNTSDVNKPVSTPQQTALNLKANSANPVFTGGTTIFSTEVVRHDPAAGVNAGYEVGSTAGQATTPYMDFHCGATATDYDFRLLFSGGTGTVGQGSAKFIGGDVAFQCKATFAFPMQLPQYTVSTLPSAAAYSGFLIDVTNAQGGPKVCRSDGSAWKILNGTTTVS